MHCLTMQNGWYIQLRRVCFDKSKNCLTMQNGWYIQPEYFSMLYEKTV